MVKDTRLFEITFFIWWTIFVVTVLLITTGIQNVHKMSSQSQLLTPKNPIRRKTSKLLVVNRPKRGTAVPENLLRTQFIRLGHISNEVSYYPLYGKPMDRRQNRWYYYIVLNKSKHNPIIVSVVHDNRDCMSDHGCKQLYSDELVSFTGNVEIFTVKLYNTFAY